MTRKAVVLSSFSRAVSVSGLAIGLVSLGACSSSETRVGNYSIIDGQRFDAPDLVMGDPTTIRAIIDEGTTNSQVMDILETYTVEYGPRLTGSTRLEQSQRWARDRFAEWGLSNARMDQWGTIATRFDRGPSTGSVVLMPENPDDEPEKLRDLEITTLSWSPGTDGPVRGHAVALPKTMSEYESNRGSFSGAWVLIDPLLNARTGVRSTGYLMRERFDERHAIRSGDHGSIAPSDESESAPETPGVAWRGSFDYNGTMIPTTIVIDETDDGISGAMSIEGFAEGPIEDATRQGDVLAFNWTHSMGTSEITLTIDGDRAEGRSVSSSGAEYVIEMSRANDEISEEQRVEMERVEALTAVLEENPAGFVSSSRDERVWTTSANNWREREASDYPVDTEVNIRQSDYDYIKARISEGMDIRVEFDMKNEIVEGPIPVYNVIAEIRGTEKPDEVVIISAHIDSWDGPGSMGTTDNGTGTAVMTEAARILAAVGAKPKRTIRVALWSGEEQGLLGARAYVDSLSEDERSKVSAAFVDDGGTNYQGGIPAADSMVEYLAAATAPVNGVFFSKVDASSALRDDDDSNDERAGYLNVNIRPTGSEISTHGGSDHAAFNAVGIPGFFWDEVGRGDYGWTWHTQNDTFDEAIEEYLIQSAVNMAVVAYNLANAPDLLPRSGESWNNEGGYWQSRSNNN